LILDILTRISIINISSKNELASSNRQQHLKANSILNRIVSIFSILFLRILHFYLTKLAINLDLVVLLSTTEAPKYSVSI